MGMPYLVSTLSEPIQKIIQENKNLEVFEHTLPYSVIQVDPNKIDKSSSVDPNANMIKLTEISERLLTIIINSLPQIPT